MVVQIVASSSYFFMGLGWGGFWYLVAVSQAVLVIVAMLTLLVRRKPLITLPLPLLSAVLVLTCWTIDEALDARICSAEALAAVTSLSLPPDLTEGLEFEGDIGTGCVAHFNSGLSEADYIQHYVDQGRRDGWEVVEDVPAHRAMLHNGSWAVTAEVNPEDTGLYILSIREWRD